MANVSPKLWWEDPLLQEIRVPSLQFITMSVENRLAEFLRMSQIWEKRPINMWGVFLLKLLSSWFRHVSIAIEINPTDTAGSTTKKRGIVIWSASELDGFNRISPTRNLLNKKSWWSKSGAEIGCYNYRLGFFLKFSLVPLNIDIDPKRFNKGFAAFKIISIVDESCTFPYFILILQRQLLIYSVTFHNNLLR